MARIMIVDDQTELVEMYRDVLEFVGHKVVAIAQNGDQAIYEFCKFLQGQEPDVILMDHRMPVKDGLEASRTILAKIKEEQLHTVIVFATADQSVHSQALSIGVKQLLEKPFTIERLVGVIEKLLREM